MDIDYLLSFKDEPEVQNIDESILNKINSLFSKSYSKSYSKKIKKKVVKPVLKNNVLKSTKLQNSKNKIENKVGLILNKLSDNNFDKLIIEFIETFNDVNQDDFDLILKTFFIKLIKHKKFQNVIFNFYKTISIIYINKFNLNEKYLIDFIENKIIYDYQDKGKDIFNDINFKTLDTEDLRINNLLLIKLMIDNKKLKTQIYEIITELIIKTDYIPDVYIWFNVNKNNIKYENYFDILKLKLKNNLCKRYYVLLENLLECSFEINLDDLGNDEDIDDNEDFIIENNFINN